jgi:outer membrane lipoprotein-sorting protein
MEIREESHHDDLLDSAVEAVLSDPIPDDLPPERVSQLVAAVLQAADQPYPMTIFKRIINMRPRTRIAVAATVLIAFFGLMSWLVPGGGISVAFADVAEALTNVHSATWKTTTVTKGPKNENETVQGIGMFLTPSHERMERTTRGATEVGIFDGQKDKALILVPTKKIAIVMNLKNLPPKNPLGRTFQELRKFVTEAQSGKKGDVERLDNETIDGRSTQGFRIKGTGIEVTVWADPKTSLPIRVEEIAKDASGGTEIRTVLTDFQIGIELDESLFSLDAPSDYSIQTTAFDVSKKPIGFLAETLKMAAENNGGVFPDTLRGEQGIEGIMRRATAAMEKKYGRFSPEMIRVGSEIAPKMAAAAAILLRLSPENDWHYAGKGVKVNTPDRPIFWYKPTGTAKYGVIYADLSVKEDVSKEEASKFPESEGDSKP